MTRPLAAVPTLVTGGAGFIGGEVVARLLADGSPVTVLDDLSTAQPDWLDRFEGSRRPRFIQGDAADGPTVDAVLQGHGRVIHLASGTDIAGGFGHPELDFRNGIQAVEAVCEAMLRHDVRELWYASSGVVYGTPARTPTAEGDGPMAPASHYAAAKLAGEAIISGFAHLYGWHALAFRFGNTVGARSHHGVVHDLTVKLLRDPSHLDVLGDGSAAKPYIAVEDLVDGMCHLAAWGSAPGSLTIANLGPTGTVTVRRVAEIVLETVAAGPPTTVTYASHRPDGGGWPGDTPLVDFDTTVANDLGWTPSMSGEAAIRAAVRGIADRYRSTGAPLLTSLERQAAATSSQRTDALVGA